MTSPSTGTGNPAAQEPDDWFRKAKTERADEVLFIDARNIYRQIDRAHREFTKQQIEFLANIVRQWRGEDIMLFHKSDALLEEHGLRDGYADIAGLCKAASRAEIEAQGWSLNPGRYVGAAVGEDDDVAFMARMAELAEEFEALSTEAESLRATVIYNAAQAMGR